jgi:HAD superfamily phosphoserine phosphatase-like hydrolase
MRIGNLLPSGRWSPDVFAALNRMLAEHGVGAAGYDASRPPVATFDWDNTCAKGDIGESVMDALDLRDGGDRNAEYLRLCQTEGKAAGYAYCAFQIAGMSAAQAAGLAAQVIESRCRSGHIVVRPEMRDLMSAMRECGWQVWIVSASAQVLVQVFAKQYGIDGGRVIGVRLQTDAKGILLPALDGPMTFREGKVHAIQKFIGLMPLFAAGDTDTDVEMLQAARHRLLIDSGNPVARSAAKAGNWWIQPPFEA